MGKWDDLFDDAPAESTPVRAGPVDAGPEARRAAAGLPPGPRMTDPSPDLEPQFATVRTVSGEGQPGRLRLPPPSQPGVPAPIRDASKFRMGQGERAATELEGDPLAQMITAGALGAGAGGTASAIARGIGGNIVGTAVAPTARVLAEGGTTAAASGSNPVEGIALSGLLRIGSQLEGIGQAYRNVGLRRDAGIMRDLGTHGTDAQKTELMRSGAQKVGELSRRYKVAGAPDVETMKNNAKSGVQAVGSDIGATYNTLGTQYARPLGDVMVTANRLQESLRGTRSGDAMADAIHDEMTKLFQAHGGNKDALIPLGVLRQEVTDSQYVGFAGKKFGQLPETMKAEVQRQMTKALQHELDIGLTAAAKDPRFTSMIERLDQLNGDYHALKTIEAVAERMAGKAPFRPDPTLRDRVSLRGPPPGRAPIKPPSGRSLGPLPVEPLPQNMTSALARGDRDAAAVEMANALFGRPVLGLSPVAPKPLEPGVGAVREAVPAVVPALATGGAR